MPVYEGIVYRLLESSIIENLEEFWRLHQPGSVVQYSAFNSNEKEILFGRDTNFIVTEVKSNTIFMEEV